MKKLLFVCLFFPLLTFSQNIVGTWVKSKKAKDALVFNADSSVKTIDLATGESQLKNITARYSLSQAGSDKFIEQRAYNQEGKLINTIKYKYKITGDTLYLPRFVRQSGGTEAVEDFKVKYTRVK